MNGFALFGCMALMMCLGIGVKETPRVFNHTEKMCILVVISLWYTLVSTGVVASSYGRSTFALFYAFVTSRVGMLGMR